MMCVLWGKTAAYNELSINPPLSILYKTAKPNWMFDQTFHGSIKFILTLNIISGIPALSWWVLFELLRFNIKQGYFAIKKDLNSNKSCYEIFIQWLN